MPTTRRAQLWPPAPSEQGPGGPGVQIGLMGINEIFLRLKPFMVRQTCPAFSAYPTVCIPSPPGSGVLKGAKNLARIAEDTDHQVGPWALWLLYKIRREGCRLREAF